jgi:muramoyltetrapeptide carboxypeptidase
MTSIIKPKPLRRGDAISVVVPAGPVNRERIDRALTRVAERGLRIKTYGDIYRSCGYLAGDDATRADELMAAFSDPETSAVWCARGGYGVVRLLERIDFNVIRKNPKVFVGFSDITILHCAIQQRTGLITFHGPNLQDGFGKPDEMPAANEASLWQAVGDNANEDGYRFDLSGVTGAAMSTIGGGVARGRLTGGNLAVLCGLMGTPCEMDTTGRILFIEDVSERVYRVDRYLSQLSISGKLKSAAGVLVGTFSYDAEDEPDSETAVRAVVEEYLRPLRIPVLAGFPAGHTSDNLTLPMGAMVEMDANRQTLTVCERPTE